MTFSNKTINLSDKKLSFLLAFLVAIMPFSIDSYLPAMTEMASHLHTSIPRIEQSLSAFMIGVACGQLIGGAYSDIKGRRLIAIIGLSIFLGASCLLIFTNSAWQLLILRFIQAIGGGMATVIVGATVRDRYNGIQAAQMFATIAIIILIAPLIAPFLGAIINDAWGWQYIFVFIMIYAAVLLVFVYQFLPNNPLRPDPETKLLKLVIDRYWSVLKNKEALGFLFVQALSFACMFVFITESTFVYREYFGLSGQHYAWAFALNILTLAIFNRFTAWRLSITGTHRLLILGLAIQFISAGIIFTWVILGNPPLSMVIIFMMITVGAQGLISPNAQAIYMSYFKEESGTANAVLGTSFYTISALAGMITSLLHNGQLWPMPFMMFVCTCLSITLVFTLSRQAWRT